MRPPTIKENCQGDASPEARCEDQEKNYDMKAVFVRPSLIDEYDCIKKGKRQCV